jgi:aminoglycoside 6-adenylyltransferase
MCVDAYLKQRLLRMIEFYCYKVEGRDVWHDGRFIDRWADDWILNDIKKCFAHYESEDVKSALYVTHLLFEKVTRRIAEAEGYTYPERAKDCAYAFLKS